MSIANDPWAARETPVRADATRAERDLFLLQVDPVTDERDSDLDVAAFAYLEAIYRLTMGLPGAWADQCAVERAFAVLLKYGRQGVGARAKSTGLTEEIRHGEGSTGRWGARGRRVLVRASREGSAEHFAQRPVLLSLLGASA